MIMGVRQCPAEPGGALDLPVCCLYVAGAAGVLIIALPHAMLAAAAAAAAATALAVAASAVAAVGAASGCSIAWRLPGSPIC